MGTMIRGDIAAAMSAALLLFSAHSASAQTATWEGRGFISVNGAFQSSQNDFTNNETFTTNIEQGRLAVAYPVKAAPIFDVGGGVRVWRGFAVGVAVSSYSKSTAAAVDASIPHPFFFNRNRAVSGSSDPMERQELGLHISALWMIPLNARLSVAAFGGPTYFNVKQQIVQTVRYSDTYPFDTATYTGVDVTSESKGKFGFNAGVDVTYMLNRTVGVGGTVRISRATVDFGTSGGASLSVDVGGLQTGGGVRLRF